jgi:hypothetical protein
MSIWPLYAGYIPGTSSSGAYSNAGNNLAFIGAKTGLAAPNAAQNPGDASVCDAMPCP